MQDFSNIWFNYNDNTFDPAVLACANGIVLLDRRKIPEQTLNKEFLHRSKQYPWAVYDCTRKNFGEWLSYKIRKQAVVQFVRKAMSVSHMDYPRLLDGTVAEQEWKSRESYFAKNDTDGQVIQTMVLNRETFDKVREITGYEHVEYHAAKSNPFLVKFLVYDGPRVQPTCGQFVWVNENFEVCEVEPHEYSIAEDDLTIRRVVTPMVRGSQSPGENKMSEWPFGKPQTTPGAYSGDYQNREDSGFQLKWRSEGMLTPTKRLKRSANPDRYKQNLNRSIEIFENLKGEFPDRVDHYDRWIQECRELLNYVQ